MKMKGVKYYVATDYTSDELGIDKTIMMDLDEMREEKIKAHPDYVDKFELAEEYINEYLQLYVPHIKTDDIEIESSLVPFGGFVTYEELEKMDNYLIENLSENEGLLEHFDTMDIRITRGKNGKYYIVFEIFDYDLFVIIELA
jgi:hypothetical protein